MDPKLPNETPPNDPRVDGPPEPINSAPVPTPNPPAPPAPPVPPEPSVKDLLARMDSMAATIETQNSELAALKKPAQPVLEATNDEYAPTKNFAELYGVPQEAVRDIVREAVAYLEPRAVRKAQAYIEQRDASVALRTKFYTDHPDLVGYEDLVRPVADEVARVNPNATVAEAFKDTAKITRAKIKMIQDKVSAGRPPEPPTPLPSSSVNGVPGGTPTPPDRPLTPEEELKADLADRRKLRDNAVSSPR